MSDAFRSPTLEGAEIADRHFRHLHAVQACWLFCADCVNSHSPGFVDLRGKDEILNSVKESVSLFLESADAIQKAHDDLRAFMTNSKVLSITGGTKDLGAELLGELQKLTAAFYQVLPIDGKLWAQVDVIEGVKLSLN